MNELTEEAVAIRIQKYIQENVKADHNPEVGLDSPLLELGLLNSFEMVKMINYLSNEFTMDIGPDQVTFENFYCIRSLAKLVLGIKRTQT